MAHTSVAGFRGGWIAFVSAGLLLTSLAWAARKPAAHAQAPQAKAAAAPPTVTSDDAETIRILNEKLAQGWKANKLAPSARCSDHEFIRRASLDLIGRIAKVEEIQRFLKDPPDSRRRLLIDRLLANEEFAENWANLWRVWLMTRSGALDPNRAIFHEQMKDWLHERFAQPSLSWKELVTELITATGKTNENGAVNFILAHLGEAVPGDKRSEEGYFEMVPITSRVTKLFLGLQTQCTQCHDHPFNPEWKQHHFWGINAFFRQIRREGILSMRRQDTASPLTLNEDTAVNRDAIVYFEKRNGVVLPTRPVFLDGTKLDPEQHGSSRRQALALFLTRHDNFPKAIVNRLWGHFFGRGFTNPVDDFGEHNPVSNPELLDELAQRFVKYGYNPRHLVRWICNSEAYSLSSVANATNEKADAEPFFSRMLLKAMSPEQLYDSLLIATQAEYFESRDNKRNWMRTLTVNFGDDEGNEVTFNGTVVQALLMMNGQQINEALANDKRGTIVMAAKRKGSVSGIISELYLAALNRPPTSTESSRINKILATAPVKKQNPLGSYQDLFWALLNCNEFILNH